MEDIHFVEQDDGDAAAFAFADFRARHAQEDSISFQAMLAPLGRAKTAFSVF